MINLGDLLADADVITEGLSQLSTKKRPDKELLDLLNGSWAEVLKFINAQKNKHKPERSDLVIVGALSLSSRAGRTYDE